jgi:two-component system response regulator FixJ
MPDMSGFEVLQAIRERQIAVPVVVVTGHDEPGMEVSSRKLGAAAYLKKPVERNDLLAAIAAASSAGSA